MKNYFNFVMRRWFAIYPEENKSIVFKMFLFIGFHLVAGFIAIMMMAMGFMLSEAGAKRFSCGGDPTAFGWMTSLSILTWIGFLKQKLCVWLAGDNPENQSQRER